MRQWKTLLCLILLLCLSTALCAPASAEESAAERGLEKLKTARNWDCIVLPQEESYLEDWKTLYGRKAWNAPSLFVETMPMMNSGVEPQPSLFEGTEVTVVAEENDMSCILYRAPNYKLYAGWIKSIRLLEEFPGEQHSVGIPREGEFECVHEAGDHWSNGYLPGTEQFYTVLDETVENCVGFTLEYQLIGENTAVKELVWGPRTVWVSDGENWKANGSFPYPDSSAVRVQVWLPEPMKVAAVATWAHCDAPNLFEFRQRAVDFLIAPQAGQSPAE